MTSENASGRGERQESFYDGRIEVAAGQRADVLARLVYRPCHAVGPFRGERGGDIHHREEARGQRNLLADKAPWVATPIPFLVVAVGDIEGGAQVGDGGEHRICQGGVAAHNGPL